MNNFGKYLTPEQALEEYESVNGGKSPFTLKQLKQMARNNSLCDACETNPIWRMVGNGMCFTCTTGEADASDDSELELLTGPSLSDPIEEDGPVYYETIEQELPSEILLEDEL